MKTALITGATAGICKELALSLAKEGYSIHFLSRSVKKGEDLLDELDRINPDGEHKCYQVDLGLLDWVYAFLEQYKEQNNSLDLLILGAHPLNSQMINVDISIDCDPFFMIEFISRYLFVIDFAQLLACGQDPRIIHLGWFSGGTLIDFEKMASNDLDKHTWWQGYYACALMAYHFDNKNILDIPQELIEYGLLVDEYNENHKFLTLLGGHDPAYWGELLKDHIVSTKGTKNTGQYYSNKGKPKYRKAFTNEDNFNALMEFAHRVTGVHYPR